MIEKLKAVQDRLIFDYEVINSPNPRIQHNDIKLDLIESIGAPNSTLYIRVYSEETSNDCNTSHVHEYPYQDMPPWQVCQVLSQYIQLKANLLETKKKESAEELKRLQNIVSKQLREELKLIEQRRLKTAKELAKARVKPLETNEGS